MSDLIKANSNGQWELLEKAVKSPFSFTPSKTPSDPDMHGHYDIYHTPSGKKIGNISVHNNGVESAGQIDEAHAHQDEHIGALAHAHHKKVSSGFKVVKSDELEKDAKQDANTIKAVKATLGEKKSKSFKEQVTDIKMKYNSSFGKGEECIKADANGQWQLEKDNSVKPFGTSVYNSTANIGRKMNRTGAVVEGVGRNNATHNYTTSGATMQAAHEVRQNKEMKAKSKVRTIKDMSPEEIKAIEDKQGK